MPIKRQSPKAGNILRIRKAKTSDIKQIQKLINEFAKKEQMLPRSLNDLYESIRDLFVCEADERIKGACALHILWDDLAEIRSLAVSEDSQGTGIGKRLLAACLKEAEQFGVKRVFALTYQSEFFKKMGFSDIDKSKLPQKIWGDCLRCPRFPECDEDAVIREFSRAKPLTCIKSCNSEIEMSGFAEIEMS
ncbi:MAG: N-acetyltransferase [Nitrospirae bacterium]|nr:N-acetyltransferase [Nitrospirota bacterium]